MTENVWIVIEHDWPWANEHSQEVIRKVFDSKEKAEAWVNQQTLSCNFDIHRHRVD